MKLVKWVLSAIIILILALFFGQLGIMQSMSAQQASFSDGVIDLQEVDTDNTIVQLSTNWDYYPGKLYAPGDLANGNIEEARAFLPEDESTYSSGTYHAQIYVEPGKTYAIAAWSVDYAMRIYVDGVIALDVGTVTETEVGFEPRIQYYTLPIYAQDDTIEIILQYANFAHKEGGKMREMAFSTLENIQKYTLAQMLPTYILSGGLILLAMFYLVQFLVYRKPELAIFALCCLLFALRSQQLIISVLPLEYDWYALYRGFFIGSSLMSLCFLLLSYTMHPHWFKKWVLPITFAIVGAIDIAVLFIPVMLASQLVNVVALCTVPALLYYFVRLFMLLKKGARADKLAVVGMLVFLVTYILELTLASDVPVITRMGLSPVGMVVFVLCYTMAFNLRARQTATSLAQERQRAENLAQVDALKTEFLANVTHELKTPLAVVSGYAQDTLAVLGEKTPELGDIEYNQKQIVNEAGRLDRMVSQLLDVAAIENGRMRMRRSPQEIAPLLRQVVQTHSSLLHTNSNDVHLDIEDRLPQIPVDTDRIRQVLLNLFSNAARHTKNGVITVSAWQGGGNIAISVADTGEGIDAEVLPQVFRSYVERQTGMAGRSGMGLYICQKIIDAHGGTIQIESRLNEGTTVTFTLPGLEEKP